jgi:hypothetical protein
MSHGDKKEPLRICRQRPYRKPTQVGEMSILRRAGELALRNSAKCTRNFGRSVASGGCNSLVEVAESRPRRLFTKNTGLCEAVMRRIGTDTCPVPEG